MQNWIFLSMRGNNVPRESVALGTARVLHVITFIVLINLANGWFNRHVCICVSQSGKSGTIQESNQASGIRTCKAHYA